MNCPECGLPLVHDELGGELIIWCPKCGKDYTYDCYESQHKCIRSGVEREPCKHEVSSVLRN